MKSKATDYRVIMGIDPGTNYTGFGVLEINGGKLRSIDLGTIELTKLGDPYLKLKSIFCEVTKLVKHYKPDEIALESPFFGKNVQSMLKLGRAQGVAMAAALSLDIPVSEYAPRRIKQAITGNGAASKEQVAALLKQILSLEEIPKKLDATDGLAVAVCHYFESCSPLNKFSERNSSLGGGLRATSAKGSSSWERFVVANPERTTTQQTTTKARKK